MANPITYMVSGICLGVTGYFVYESYKIPRHNFYLEKNKYNKGIFISQYRNGFFVRDHIPDNIDCLERKGYKIHSLKYQYPKQVYIEKQEDEIVVKQFLLDCKECDVHSYVKCEYVYDRTFKRDVFFWDKLEYKGINDNH